MAEKKGTVPFAGTKEQEEALKKVIDELKSEKGALMPILQKAQDIYGYLPMEVQKMISDQTGIPMEKIYGVATFYSQFTLSPKGRYRISVCLGTACYVKGSGDIYNALMEKAGNRRRRVYAGRKVLTGCMPVCRGLRAGTGHDDQRRSVRTSDRGRSGRNPGKVRVVP